MKENTVLHHLGMTAMRHDLHAPETIGRESGHRLEIHMTQEMNL